MGELSSPDSLEVCLHEQRLQALMFGLIADDLQARLQKLLHVHGQKILLKVHRLEDLEEMRHTAASGSSTLSPLAAPACSSRAAVGKALADYEEAAWLQVVAACMHESSKLWSAGQRVGCDEGQCSQPWRAPVCVAHGLRTDGLVRKPLHLAACMLALWDNVLQVSKVGRCQVWQSEDVV